MERGWFLLMAFITSWTDLRAGYVKGTFARCCASCTSIGRSDALNRHFERVILGGDGSLEYLRRKANRLSQQQRWLDHAEPFGNYGMREQTALPLSREGEGQYIVEPLRVWLCSACLYQFSAHVFSYYYVFMNTYALNVTRELPFLHNTPWNYHTL